MSTERLNQILRERRETGAYGEARLVLSKATLDAMPRPGDPLPYEEPEWAMARLFSIIPLFLDNTLPYGAWRLIGNDGDEIESEGVPA